MSVGLFKSLSFLVLFIYLLVCVGNLYMIYVGKGKVAKIFRVLLMPILAVFYFLAFRNHSIYIYIAILLFWISDLFLTESNLKNALFGFFLYANSNLLFMKELVPNIKFADLNYILTIFVFLFYLGLVGFFIFITFERTRAVLKSGIRIVSFSRIVSALLCIFSVLLVSEIGKGAFYIVIGSNLLFLNQLIFSHSVISKKYKSVDLFLSVSYSLATLFVVIGVGFLV